MLKENIRPIGLKLTVLLVAGIVVTYGVLTYLIIKRETTTSIKNTLHFAELTADTVKAVLAESMIEGNPEETEKYLRKLSREGNLVVKVYNQKGNEVFGGDETLSIPEEISIGLKPVSMIREENARFFMPLINERPCMKCHRGGRLRGVVVVDIPLAHAKAEILETERRLLLYGAFIVVLGIIGTVVIVNRMIAEPVKKIDTAIRSFMTGGGHYKISLKGRDELSEVADAFNTLCGQLSEFHTELERMVQERTEALQQSKREVEQRKDALKRYSEDLRKVSGFSNRFVRRDKSLTDVLSAFVTAIREELGYPVVALYLLDHRDDELKRVAFSGDTDLLKVEEDLMAIFYTGEIVTRESGSSGEVNIFVPIYGLKKGTCYELNECDLTDCPCYGRDMRCWQIPHTRCEKRHGAGLGSCRQCLAFPLRGLLLLGKGTRPNEQDIGLIEVVSSEIALLCEVYDLIRYEKNMVKYLMEIHRAFLKTQAAEDITEVFRSMADSPEIKSIIPGMALYMPNDEGRMHVVETNLGEEFPVETFSDIFGDEYFTEPVDLYDIKMENYYSVVLCPLIREKRMLGLMGFFFTHKGFLLPEERAVALVLAQNIAGNIENIRLRTGLEKSNLELKNQKDFIEGIINSINSGIIVINEEGMILNANPYALQSLGYTKEDILGLSVDEAVPGLRELHKKGENEGSVLLASGREIYIGFSCSPFRGQEGEHGTVILFRDLTEIIELRNELQRKKYFSTIGEMASLIAHEVRNPIFAISS
ncbi:MAG: PAS domain S-box protein, partial [Nitrospirae bacterium]